MKELVDFINSGWDKTLRYTPNDDGNFYGLPHPYTVPCINDKFNELFYWDTYFTNVGLILSGKVDYARHNTEDIASLIDRLGFMPNASREAFRTRSQPPFFSIMVREVYEAEGEREWLRRMYYSIQREYEFWQTKRMTPSGLNRYYHNYDNTDAEALKLSAGSWARRTGQPMPESEEGIFEFAQNMRIVCESGMDCTSRFGNHLDGYNWVDLNSLLYALEDNMVYFSGELGLDGELWRKRRDERAALMRRLMWNEKIGAFTDYNYESGEQSDFVCMACFYPLFVGLATAEEAASTIKLLPLLKQQYGYSSTAKYDGMMNLQWDYPQGWGPHHHVLITGLDRYGYRAEAREAANMYSALVERSFRKTGNIWEKYDVVSGTAASEVAHDDKACTMMGWSAGVYLFALERAK